VSSTEPSLSTAEQRALLELARAAIGERLFSDGRLEQALHGMAHSQGLERHDGLFVTLKQIGGADSPSGVATLRGCIGTMESTRPLYREVVEMAPKAAFDDPRFAPLSADEIDGVTLSLSVLTPMKRIADWREITIGRDGVQLVRGAYRSVFLPQVAEEQRWDRQRLLTQLSLKAGLDPGAWRSGELYTFQAESFGESDHFDAGG
jgi:AmmeMemoRadiSam system protein A